MEKKNLPNIEQESNENFIGGLNQGGKKDHWIQKSLEII